MALETTKTTYLNGSSKDGNRVLANFSSSLSESGTMTINETISESTNLDTVEADFNEFREIAKGELKKLNGQDVSSDKSEDSKVPETDDNGTEETVKNDATEEATTISDSEEVRDVKPVSTSAKPETDTSDTKDGEATNESN